MCIAQPRHELSGHHGAVTAMVFSLVLSSHHVRDGWHNFSVGCWTQVETTSASNGHCSCSGLARLLFETTR